MSLRVMVIDDSESDLLFTGIMLERCGAGFSVLRFERAVDALEHLRGPDRVDLILLDINMPGMDGFEFLTAHGQLAPERQAPIVMLTSSPDPLERERALAHAQVRHYVVKPLDRQTASQLVGHARG